MARLEVFANPEASERRFTPYLLDVQNDYIDSLETRVVIPLRRETAFGPRARDLHPVLVVGSDRVVLDTAAIAAVPRSELRQSVMRLPDARAEVQAALDTLFGTY